MQHVEIPVRVNPADDSGNRPSWFFDACQRSRNRDTDLTRITSFSVRLMCDGACPLNHRILVQMFAHELV